MGLLGYTAVVNRRSIMEFTRKLIDFALNKLVKNKSLKIDHITLISATRQNSVAKVALKGVFTAFMS